MCSSQLVLGVTVATLRWASERCASAVTQGLHLKLFSHFMRPLTENTSAPTLPGESGRAVRS